MNGPQPVIILIRGRDSGRHETTVTAGPTPVPGLVINEDPVMRGMWNITHAPSGAAVAGLFESPEHALHVATRLAGVCDWTMSGEEMAEVRYDLRSAVLGALDGAGTHHLGSWRSMVPDSALRGGRVNGFCSSPGHQDIPARLYACGWRCVQCAPGPRLSQDRDDSKQ